MHGLLVAAGARVVGSAPYTWTTAGPEAVDAYFGLVDADGLPVDGTAAEVARMYGLAPPTWSLEATTAQEVASGADLPRLLADALLVAAHQTETESADVMAGVEARTVEANAELGVEADAEAPADQRILEVARLIGWASELSEMQEPGGRRLFPGMREALPLLKGMARWAGDEQSAVDTARDFAAAVLRRDLAALAG
jgi:hypothetical protein